MDRRQLLASGLASVAAAALPSSLAVAASATEQSVKYLIIPDIMRIERQTVMEDVACNWRTVLYSVMNRWTVEDGKLKTIEVAPVDSDRYAEWLLETPPKNGIPPHVSFGGCIIPNKQGDPTFKARWEDAARRDYGVKV